MDRDFNYENNNIGYNDQYSDEDGGGIKCKNYELCNAILPKDWFEYKANYLCTNCHMMFGTWGNSNTGKGELISNEIIECPICLEYDKSISYPNCNHCVCIKCFKRCYYGDDSGKPIFPYPEIENEYYDDDDYINNPKWNIDYPLIKIYEEELDDWKDEQYEKYSNNKNLRLCSLCRK